MTLQQAEKLVHSNVGATKDLAQRALSHRPVIRDADRPPCFWFDQNHVAAPLTVESPACALERGDNLPTADDRQGSHGLYRDQSRSKPKAQRVSRKFRLRLKPQFQSFADVRDRLGLRLSLRDASLETGHGGYDPTVLVPLQKDADLHTRMIRRSVIGEYR